MVGCALVRGSTPGEGVSRLSDGQEDHGEAVDVSGNGVGCRKEYTRCGVLPDSQTGWISRGALQGPEHGAQFLHHSRRGRNGPGPGSAGGSRRHCAACGYEPDSPQADLPDGIPGYRARPGHWQLPGERILRTQEKPGVGGSREFRAARPAVRGGCAGRGGECR